MCCSLSVGLFSLWLSSYVIWAQKIQVRERFCHMVLGGKVPAAPVSVTNRVTHFEFPFYFQGELEFWLFKDCGSTCISFEYFVVDCLADPSFPGVRENNRLIDIFWWHRGPRLQCSACYIASNIMISLLCDEQTAKTALSVGRHSRISCTWF